MAFHSLADKTDNEVGRLVGLLVSAGMLLFMMSLSSAQYQLGRERRGGERKRGGKESVKGGGERRGGKGKSGGKGGDGRG